MINLRSVYGLLSNSYLQQALLLLTTHIINNCNNPVLKKIQFPLHGTLQYWLPTLHLHIHTSAIVDQTNRNH